MNVMLLRISLLAAVATLSMACGGLHNLDRVPAPPPPVAAPAPPALVAASAPLRFPIATSSRQPLQADLDRLESALLAAMEGELCAHVEGRARQLPDADAVLQWRTAFGTFADRFAATYAAVLLHDPSTALLARAISEALTDVRTSEYGQQFESAQDYLLFALATGALQRVCSADDIPGNVAFELLELATHHDAIRQLIVDTATQPLSVRSSRTLAATVLGDRARFEPARPYRWMRATWDTRSSVPGSLPAVEVRTEGDWGVTVATIGAEFPGLAARANGVIDAGDRISLVPGLVNLERFAFDSASLAVSTLPDCAMIAWGAEELVLPELDVAASGVTQLPELYLSSACEGVQELRFDVASSDHATTAVWVFELDVSNLSVRLEPGPLDDDMPGFSERGDEDKLQVELNLLATVSDPSLTARVDHVEVVPTSAADARLEDAGLGPMLLNEQGRHRARLDIDLARHNPSDSVPPLTRPIDRTDQVWLRVDLTLSDTPRALTEAELAQVELAATFAQVIQAAEAIVPGFSALRDTLLTPSVDVAVDAVRRLDQAGVLGVNGRAEAYEYLDTLRCSGCDAGGLVRARQYFIAAMWLLCANADLLPMSGVERMLNIPPARGVAEFERAVLESFWPENDAVPPPGTDLNELRLAAEAVQPDPPTPLRLWTITRWVAVPAQP